MANLFEKLGLVERKDDAYPSDMIFTEAMAGVTNPTSVEVNVATVEDVNVETLISDIYAENALSDTAKSIYKIQELADTLPKEMRTDVKRSTVLGILKVSGLAVEDAVNDATKRLEVLDAVGDKMVSDADDKIADANSEIEDLKANIERLQKTIALKEAEKEKTAKLIADEISKVSELYKFITGGTQ